MKYIKPEMKINRFFDVIKTDENSAAANVALASANYNAATKSLAEMFTSAAESASKVLVFNWE